jgi:hypothetical protein
VLRCPVICLGGRRVWHPILDNDNPTWINPPSDRKVAKIVCNRHHPVALSRHFALKQSVTGGDQIANNRHLREDGFNAD